MRDLIRGVIGHCAWNCDMVYQCDISSKYPKKKTNRWGM